jgi:hypothetical protein
VRNRLGLLFVKETWPDENDEAEKTLRRGLQQLAEVNSTEAREKILVMEKEHAVRRHWVWAKLGLSPLARALAHLAALAAYTTTNMGGDSPEAMADLYAHGGYLADDAVLRALADVKSAEDHGAVAGAIRALYLPWVNDAAEHLQTLVASSPLPGKGSSVQEAVSVEAGTCILFVDGLRLDVAQRLAGLAKDREIRVVQGRRWAALPTVTGTAKPAVTPVAKQIVGHHLGDTFVPDVEETGQAVTQDRLRKLLEAGGYQCLSASEVGRPQDVGPRAWTEYGQFDRLGHDLQAKLACRIDEQLELVMERIEGLLTAGWRQVRVVTDHGWQLVPGGLPTMTLAKFLTGSRWSRCATVKAGAQVSVPTAGWYWNPTEVFAFGAGVRCFGEGNQYAHGGISLQECVIPDMVFSLDFALPLMTANIGDVQWLGLRCRVSVEPADTLVTADIRTKVGDAASSIVAAKPVDKDGRVGLLVEDDSLLGTTVSVVLLDISGRVIAKRATTVGGEE